MNPISSRVETAHLGRMVVFCMYLELTMASNELTIV